MKILQSKIIIGAVLLFLGLCGYFFSAYKNDNSKNAESINNQQAKQQKSEKQLLNYTKEYTLNKNLQSKIKELDILLSSTEKELASFQKKNSKETLSNNQTEMIEIERLKRDIENVKKTITSMNKNLK